VARWWPEVRPGVEIWGCDPWAEAIAWGRGALPEVQLEQLSMQPPTPFAEDQFDLVYGISILTHLPLDAQQAWLAELARIVRPGSLVALTLQGRRALDRFSPAERAAWEAGEMIERSGVQEGSRLYLAYHPPGFARDVLFADWTLLVHEEDSPVGSGGQDLWLLRRP
jgi:SAM-dependent methyltransferase